MTDRIDDEDRIEIDWDGPYWEEIARLEALDASDPHDATLATNELQDAQTDNDAEEEGP